MSQKLQPDGAAEFVRVLDDITFQNDVDNDLALYLNTGDARFVWRAIARHHGAGKPLPPALMSKLAQWAGRVLALSGADQIAHALELVGTGKDKIGPSHSSAYRRKWKLASEVQIVRRLRPDLSLKDAFEVVARNTGKSVPVVKRAYHDTMTAPTGRAKRAAKKRAPQLQYVLSAWR